MKEYISGGAAVPPKMCFHALLCRCNLFDILCILNCSILFGVNSLALICLDHGICHFGNDQLYGSDCIIVTGNDVIQLLRITVGIADTDQGNAKRMSLLYSDSLLLGIYNKDSIGNSGHVLDTAQVLL